jgi:uncharacterized protein YggU (UPF0235/DUF167 family)
LSGHPKAGKQKKGDPFILWVRVKPRSRKDEILGRGREGFLEMQVKAVPERGEANRSCCRQLARLLEVPASRVSIEKGQGSVRKKFRVEGLTQKEGDRILSEALARTLHETS